MKSTGTKAKQVAAVMERKGLSRKEATRIVTRHRLKGEAIGGYKVTSKRARLQSGNGGNLEGVSHRPTPRDRNEEHPPPHTLPGKGGRTTPGKPTPGKPVPANRNEYNRPGSLAGSNRSSGPKPHNDSPVNLPDQPKSYQKPKKGGGGRMKVT